MTRLRLRSTALFALLALVAVGAQAQYFGKNKVRYQQLDWRIYHSPHFDVYYYTDDEELLRKSVSFAESAYDKLSRIFDYQIQEPTPFIMYETHSAFQQTNIILSGVPEGVGAFATPVKFRMVLPVDSPDPELLALIEHELTHIFQYHILFRGRLAAGLRGQPPQWFMEGMASYMADDETVGDRKFMIDAVVNDNLPSVELRGGGFFAYRFGNALFSYMEERWGKDAVLDFIYEMRNTFGSRVGAAIERTFRMDVEDFDAEFRRWARAKYLPELLATGEPGDFGRPFRLDRGRIGHEMSPTASPSGDLVAALTTDLGDLDVSLFDTTTRRRIRNLTKGLDTDIRGIVVRTNREIGSDLAFSPDGNYLAAFGRREAGRSLLLFDVINGGLAKIVDMEIEQQRSPAFSPDGRYVAFSGNNKGINDIYLLDLETLEVANVTDDELFDNAPTFSPDGEWLTYTAVVGEHNQIFRLRLSDPSERFQITEGQHNSKEPAYSPDGQRLYFTSDRGNGMDNIYSLDLETGRLQQYTNAITGCDRPTVLRRPDGTEQLVYASYWKSRFGLYTTDVEEPLADATTMDVPSEPAAMAQLAGFEPDIEVALDAANDEEYGGFNFFLDNATTYFGVDTNQVFLGRILLSFSDYLGDRRIIADVAAVDTFSDFSVTYLDLRKRRQWGVRLFDQRTFAFTNRDELLVNPNADLERDEIYSITGLEYINIFPFNYNNRLEVSLGAYYRDYNGAFLWRGDDGIPTPVLLPRSDEYPQITATLVSDNTVFNQWGPATGHRVRLSGSYAPNTDESGTLVTTLSLDARQYVPVTRRSNLAFRLFGYDSSGDFPNPIVIGGLDNLRGFATNSIPGFRAFYMNAEYRFPLVDQIAFPGFAFQGIRGVLFFNIGSAWFPEINDFDFFDDEDRLDDPFATYGWGFDVNLFGLPAHWDFSRQTDLDDFSVGNFETNFWIGARF
ncbi:MAG: BamA/TamA family outer membrane protein [Acidobacteriota bacterium]